MPEMRVVFFTEDDGTVPVVDWLDALVAKVQIKCVAKLKWAVERKARFQANPKKHKFNPER
jgi:hypothetical protein